MRAKRTKRSDNGKQQAQVESADSDVRGLDIPQANSQHVITEAQFGGWRAFALLVRTAFAAFLANMRTRRIALVLVLLAGIVAAAYFFPLATWLLAFIAWVRGLGTMGVLVYGFVYVAGTVLLMPGTALTLGSGFLYGPLLGVLLVSPASVLGATISFLLARSFGRDWTLKRIGQHPRIEIIDRAIEKHGFKIVFLLRLEPLIAFVLLNYALGLTRVRLRDYVLASWLGMLPATILYVYLGSSVKNIADLVRGKLSIPGRWHEILLWGGLGAVAILVFVVTRIAREALRKELAQPSEGGGEGTV